MVPNPTPELLPPGPISGSDPQSHCRIRFVFEKSGALRWLSHHDLIRAVDRLFRRLDLPVVQSQGFHPQPALVFALSLPMGCSGHGEILEVDLVGSDWQANALLDCLNSQSPPGLRFLKACQIHPKARARVKSLEYRVRVPEPLITTVISRIPPLLESTTLLVDRRESVPNGAPSPLSGDTPGVKNLRDSVEYLDWQSPYLAMGLIPRPLGTIKPSELLASLGWPIDSEEFFYPQLERSRLTLEDDQNI